MGAGASVEGETLTKEQVQEMAGDNFDEATFGAAAGEDGTVTKAAYEEACEQHEAAIRIQARSRGRSSRRTVIVAPVADSPKTTEERIKEAFDKFDRDGSGEIGVEEVTWYLQMSSGESKDVAEAAKALMADLDNIQKDGSVSKDEWTKYFTDKGDAVEIYLATLEDIVVKASLEEQKSAQMIQARARGRATRGRGRGAPALVGAAADTEGKTIDERVVACFGKFDADGSGFLDIEELKVYLGSEAGAEKMMQDFDNIHTDGKIDLEEFQKYFKEMEPQDLVPMYLQTLETMVITISPSKAATAIQANLRGKIARKASADGAGPAEEAAAPAEEAKAE